MRLTRPTASALLSGVLLLGLLLCACGNNKITIKLDLDSFMDEESSRLPIEFSANAPGLGLPPVRSPISSVEMPEGINEIIALDDLIIDIQMDLETALVAGPGSPTVRLDFSVELFLSADPATVYNPANEFFTFAPGATLNVTETLSTVSIADESLSVSDAFLDLFQNNEMLYMGIQVSFSQLANSDIGDVEGAAITQTLHLSIIGTESMFD